MDLTAEKPIELTQSEENKPLLADRRREGKNVHVSAFARFAVP